MPSGRRRPAPLLQGGGRHLEDVRELRQEKPLLRLVDREKITDPDTTGAWLRRMGDPKNNQIGLNGLGQVRDVVNHQILQRGTRSDYTKASPRRFKRVYGFSIAVLGVQNKA